MPVVTEFGKLTQQAIEMFNRDGWFGCRALFEWMRNQKNPSSGSEQEYGPLREGRVVPWELLKAAAEYCRVELHRDLYIDEIAIKADKAERQYHKTQFSMRISPWSLGFKALQLFINPGDKMPYWPAEESFCKPHDIRQAAQMTLRYVGRAHGKKRMDEKTAEDLGQKIMDRSLADLDQQLTELWEVDPYAIMFHILDKERIGAVITFPTQERAYERYLGMHMEDSGFRKADFVRMSYFLYLFMLTEPRDPILRRSRKLAFVQLNTMLFQISMLCPTLTQRGHYPHLLTIGGTDSNEKKLKNYGFTDTKSVTPKSGKRLYELAPTDELPPSIEHPGYRQRVCYDAMWTILREYQAVFAVHRRDMERD